MVHEFALEPKLLSNWKDFRYFTEKFGVSRGRLISRYPRKWKDLVYSSLSDVKDVEKKRIVEGLVRLDDRLVTRHHIYRDQQHWLQNAEAEHLRAPFHAVIAECNPNSHDFVLVSDSLDETEPRWGVPTAAKVHRSAANMAACVGPLLECSRECVFVDPHFGPENRRHRRPLQEFLAVFAGGLEGVKCERLEYHTSAKAEANYFKEESERWLAPIIPSGMMLKLVRWPVKWKHNRYILTERGGILFGIGLDEGSEPDTDEVSLVDQNLYETLWKDFTGDTAQASFVDDFEIVGSRE